MKRLKFKDWLAQTESSIADALNEILPRDWDENDATKSWMKALRRKLREVEITDLGRPYAMAWDTVKLKGSSENLYGDVGVLVRTAYPNGVRTEGVGFIEAKRIYASGRYEEFKQDQLERMVSATGHHRLGLYEQIRIPEAAYGVAGHGIRSDLWNSVVAAVIPTTIALKMRGNRRTDFHPPCLPLSYQICARYLGGYDLDFSPKLVDSVKTGGAGAPTWLLIADVRIGGETTPTTNNIVPIGPSGPYTSVEPASEILRGEEKLQADEQKSENRQQTATIQAQKPQRVLKARG